MNNLRFAARQLARTPGFTVLAVMTLALGIGACAAIFTVVHAVLLRPFPFPQADRLVVVNESLPRPAGDHRGHGQIRRVAGPGAELRAGGGPGRPVLQPHRRGGAGASARRTDHRQHVAHAGRGPGPGSQLLARGGTALREGRAGHPGPRALAGAVRRPAGRGGQDHPAERSVVHGGGGDAAGDRPARAGAGVHAAGLHAAGTARVRGAVPSRGRPVEAGGDGLPRRGRRCGHRRAHRRSTPARPRRAAAAGR